MKRGTLTTLSIFLLVFAFGATTLDPGQADASDLEIDGIHIKSDGTQTPPPEAGGGNEDENEGPTTTQDSGDDDDTWNGIQNDGTHPVPQYEPSLLHLILESWWNSSGQVLH